MISAFLIGIFFSVGAAILCNADDFTELSIKIVGVVFLVLAVLFIALMLEINSPTETVQKSDNATTNIDTLSLASEIHGSFILGTGSVDGESIYYYMAKTPDGDQLRSLNNDEDNVFIKQDADGQAILEHSSSYSITHIKNMALAKWFGPVKSFEMDNEGNIQNGEVTEKYVFHVPAGTIVQSYKVNTQDLQQ